MDERDRNREREDEETSLESPLGIAGTPVDNDAPDHLRASNDDEEARRRRRRALADDHEPRRGMDDINYDHKGATGIDLGGHERGTK
jgi:hypothetical protein